MNDFENPLDDDLLAQLSAYLTDLPAPVHLHVWADEAGSQAERETAVLSHALAHHFPNIHFELFPHRDNYPFYPVIGVMGEDEQGDVLDYHIRIVGWPSGFQLTSLISAIQVVGLKGATLDPRTRAQLFRLSQPVVLELYTDAEDNMGTMMATIIFSLAAANPLVESFVIMADQFGEAVAPYEVDRLPHLVINGRYHISGLVDDKTILEQIAIALNPDKEAEIKQAIHAPTNGCAC